VGAARGAVAEAQAVGQVPSAPTVPELWKLCGTAVPCCWHVPPV